MRENKNRQPKRKVRDDSHIFMDANGEVTSEIDLNKKGIETLRGPGEETE